MIRKSLYLFLIFFTVALTASGEQPSPKYWNQGRGYSPFRFATSQGISINNQTAGPITDYYNIPGNNVSDFRLSFRAANHNAHPAKRYPYVDKEGYIRKKKNPEWGFFLTSKSDTIKFTVRPAETFGLISTQSITKILVTSTSGLLSDNLEFSSEKLDHTTGINLWQLVINHNGISLSGGNHKQETIANIPLPKSQIDGFGFFADSGADINITDIAFEPAASLTSSPVVKRDLKEIADNFASTEDPLEGFWVVFDRNLEESLLKPGGDYILAIVKNDAGYDLIYSEGAHINSSKWTSGHSKGRLIATHFSGIFDVEWIDAEGMTLSHGIKAQTLDNELIEIQFPYHSSSLRLRKIPEGKYIP